VVENERPTSFSDEDRNEDEVEEEKGGKVDANKSADEDENYENKTEEEMETGSSGRYCFKKENRLSRTVEFQKARQATKTKTAAIDSATLRRAECTGDQSTTRCHTILTVLLEESLPSNSRPSMTSSSDLRK
jgi:hypothetical protein